MTATEKMVFPGQIHQTADGGILVSALDDVINWARSNSLWPLVFGTSCCAIEMMSAAGSNYGWSGGGGGVGGGGPGGGVVPVERVVVASGLAPRARLEAAEEAEMAPAPLAKWWRPWWPTASCPPASLRRLKGEGQHCLTEGLSGCQFCVHASVMSHGSHSRPTGHGVECWPRPPAFQTRWWPSGRRRSGESPKTRPPSRGRAPGAGTRG